MERLQVNEAPAAPHVIFMLADTWYLDEACFAVLRIRSRQ